MFNSFTLSYTIVENSKWVDLKNFDKVFLFCLLKMGILEVPRNDRDFEDKSENDEVAQEDNVEEGNHYLYHF